MTTLPHCRITTLPHFHIATLPHYYITTLLQHYYHIAAKVVTGSGLVGELSALELGRNFHGCMRGLAIGDHSCPHLNPRSIFFSTLNFHTFQVTNQCLLSPLQSPWCNTARASRSAPAEKAPAKTRARGPAKREPANCRGTRARGRRRNRAGGESLRSKGLKMTIVICL